MLNRGRYVGRELLQQGANFLKGFLLPPRCFVPDSFESSAPLLLKKKMPPPYTSYKLPLC